MICRVAFVIFLAFVILSLVIVLLFQTFFPLAVQDNFITYAIIQDEFVPQIMLSVTVTILLYTLKKYHNIEFKLVYKSMLAFVVYELILFSLTTVTIAKKVLFKDEE